MKVVAFLLLFFAAPIFADTDLFEVVFVDDQSNAVSETQISAGTIQISLSSPGGEIINESIQIVSISTDTPGITLIEGERTQTTVGDPPPVLDETNSIFADAEVRVDVTNPELIKNSIENDGCITISINFLGGGTLGETVNCPFKIRVDFSSSTSSFSFPDGSRIPTSGTGSTPIVDAKTENGTDSNTFADAVDPISMATREYFFYQNLLDLNGPTLPLTFDLFHGSQLPGTVSFGHMPEDFAHNHQVTARKLDLGGGGFFFQLQFHLGLGFVVSFERTGDETDWRLVSGYRWQFEVQETANSYFLKDPASQRVWVFEKLPNDTIFEPARCLQILDQNGNSLTYSYGDTPFVNGPTSVTDGLGRTLNFDYAIVSGGTADARPYLSQVTDHTGRSISLNYQQLNNTIKLTEILDALNGAYNCTYDNNGFLTDKSFPEGNVPFTQIYEAFPDFNFLGEIGAVTGQNDIFGNTSTFETKVASSSITNPVVLSVPNLGDKETIMTNPDGSKVSFFHSEVNIQTAQIDELGKVLTFTPDNDKDRFTAYQDRDGNKGSYTYHPSGHLASMTDARGHTTTFTYSDSAPQTYTNPANAETAQFSCPQLDQITYADNSTRTFTYDPNGNLLTSTNRENETTIFTYNPLGQVLTRTNPEGGVTTITYEAATALPKTLTDSDTGVTTYTYDSFSRLTGIENPDTSTRSFTYDALNRLETAVDEDNITTRLTYDKNGNITVVTIAEGTADEQTYTLEYDARDRLSALIDPANQRTELSYSDHDNPTQITHPDLSTTQLTYNANRGLISITDETGQTTTIGRSKSQLVTSVTNAANRTTRFQRDPIGAVTRVTDGSDDTSEVVRNVFSSAESFSDGLKRLSTFARDQEQRITSRTEPSIGTTEYDYDDNGRLIKLTDTRNEEWDFSYTSMGRRTSIEDPLNRSTTRTYDNRGRLETQTHADNVVETFVYNPDNALASRTWSDGLAHTFSYNSRNEFDGHTRTLGGETETVSYTYDVLSNIESTTVNSITSSATFDVRNRLRTVTYPDGITTVTYTYNARGDLVSVTDSLTGTTCQLDHDNGGLFTRLTRSNGRVTTHSYDDEGLIASITEDTGANFAFNFNSADEPTRINENGYPATATGALTASTETFALDAAGQITNAGLAYDQRGRPTNCTWDSDNRLVQVTNGANTISYRYDALGTITSRDLNGTLTRYAYNAALGRNPIIGEKTGSSFDRLYIFTPSGSLLYLIEDPQGTPTVRHYHFGRTANVRFLTDASGNVTDSYAYDAYGKLVARTGSSPQIYTYVGGFGVRTDFEADLLHMKQRYYDPRFARFVSPDPIFERLMQRDGIHANPYHYVSGGATYRSDPSGLDVDDAGLESIDCHLENLPPLGTKDFPSLDSEDLFPLGFEDPSPPDSEDLNGMISEAFEPSSNRTTSSALREFIRSGINRSNNQQFSSQTFLTIDSQGRLISSAQRRANSVATSIPDDPFDSFSPGIIDIDSSAENIFADGFESGDTSAWTDQ